MLLVDLQGFYRNEKAGLPHEKAALWQLGWELARVLTVYGVDAWKNVNPDEERELVELLRQAPDAVLIDTAVNLLHWALLHSQASGPGWEEEFNAVGRDVVQYILSRPDA